MAWAVASRNRVPVVARPDGDFRPLDEFDVGRGIAGKEHVATSLSASAPPETAPARARPAGPTRGDVRPTHTFYMGHGERARHSWACVPDTREERAQAGVHYENEVGDKRPCEARVDDTHCGCVIPTVPEGSPG